MHDVDVLGFGTTARVAGILDAEPTKHGHRLRRLPAWTRDQLLDPSLRFVATVPSGARIELITDSTSVEIEGLLTFLQFDDDPLRPAVFELAIDGVVVASRSVTQGRVIRTDRRTLASEVVRGPTVTVRFEGLDARRKHVEVWLPHTSPIELQAVRVDDRAHVARVEDGRFRWVHYGSSISQSGEADVPTGVWPVVAARLAGADLQSLGFAGQCHLDQLVARTIRDIPADGISLKVGINVINGDTMRERTFIPAVQGFLDTVRDGHPATPVVVVTPIICPVAEAHPGPTLSDGRGPVWVVDRPPALATGALTLERIREILREVVTLRQKHGDENLHLIEGHDLFGDADLADLPDGLHPNARGYRRIGERFHRLAFTDGGPFAQTA